jgi:hypothetical protein
VLRPLPHAWAVGVVGVAVAVFGVACTTPQAVLTSSPPTSGAPAQATTTVPAGTSTPSASAEPATTEPATTEPATTEPATTVTTVHPAPTSAGGTSPAFAATVSTVTAADLGSSWRPGCPVGPEDLRLVHLSYWGFDDAPHTGALVVHRDVADDIVTVFRRLYDQRFPIRRMQPVDAFGGDDAASTAADNTAAFNCRDVVASGPPRWSVHALGKAIDVNPVENPYLEGGEVLPPNGAPYVDRSQYRPGMAVEGGQLNAAFAAVGWYWGGEWAGSPDYQHFSATGG